MASAGLGVAIWAAGQPAASGIIAVALAEPTARGWKGGAGDQNDAATQARVSKP